METDEDPGGALIERSMIFYGLWPRFDAPDEPEEDADDVRPFLTLAES